MSKNNEELTILNDISMEIAHELLPDRNEEITSETLEENLFSIPDVCEAFLELIGKKIHEVQAKTEVVPSVQHQKASARRRLYLRRKNNEVLVMGPWVNIPDPYYFSYFGMNYCIPANSTTVYYTTDESDDEPK